MKKIVITLILLLASFGANAYSPNVYLFLRDTGIINHLNNPLGFLSQANFSSFAQADANAKTNPPVMHGSVPAGAFSRVICDNSAPDWRGGKVCFVAIQPTYNFVNGATDRWEGFDTIEEASEACHAIGGGKYSELAGAITLQPNGTTTESLKYIQLVAVEATKASSRPYSYAFVDMQNRRNGSAKLPVLSSKGMTLSVSTWVANSFPSPQYGGTDFYKNTLVWPSYEVEMHGITIVSNLGSYTGLSNAGATKFAFRFPDANQLGSAKIGAVCQRLVDNYQIWP